MKPAFENNETPIGHETLLTHGGRDPAAHGGFVNTPPYRGSTIIFPTLDALEDYGARYRYGRQGTPLTSGLEEIVSELEGAAGTLLAPSGVSAISLALLSCLSSGDEIMITDNVYEPTRRLADTLLSRMGITVRYFDPRFGREIESLIGPSTRAIFLESPGSLTFELQDLPAIAQARGDRKVAIIVDNSWATPLYYKPLALGADIVIHSGTKMFVGHSDAMLGTVSANRSYIEQLTQTTHTLGVIASPDDTFLALRGMRTLAIRMEAHQERAIDMARWLEEQSGVVKVFHPALPSHPDHALFKRDFAGSGSLFSVLLEIAPRDAVAALVDGLSLFGMGYSWGGFESLILPTQPARVRTAVPWLEKGNLFRLHIGLENMAELKADLAAGLERYRSKRGM